MSTHRRASSWILARGIVFIAVFGSAAPLGAAISATVEFYDGVFSGSDWDCTVFYEMGNGGASFGRQVLEGGAPGQYRAVLNICNESPPYSGFLAFHRCIPAIYDPSIEGAVLSVDFSEFACMFEGEDQGQTSGPALRQNGQVYVGPVYITPEWVWTQHSLYDLTAQDFAVWDDEASHPDFSEAGGPIELGLVRGNWGAYGGYTISHAIDNWRVVLTTASPSWAGACCFGVDLCLVFTETECLGHGGMYQGAGVPCEPNPCLTSEAYEPSSVAELRAFPNPAVRTARIAARLPGIPLSDLAICDAAGRRVRSFFPNCETDFLQVSWDGTDDSGRPVPSGVYFLRLRAHRLQLQERLLLIR